MLSPELIFVATASGVGCMAVIIGVIRPELAALRDEVRRVHNRLDEIDRRGEPAAVHHVRRVR